MKNLQLTNILITFISDNENIIRSLEKDLEELTEEFEGNREGLELEISERADMVESAKLFLKEINN